LLYDVVLAACLLEGKKMDQVADVFLNDRRQELGKLKQVKGQPDDQVRIVFQNKTDTENPQEALERMGRRLAKLVKKALSREVLNDADVAEFFGGGSFDLNLDQQTQNTPALYLLSRRQVDIVLESFRRTLKEDQLNGEVRPDDAGDIASVLLSLGAPAAAQGQWVVPMRGGGMDAYKEDIQNLVSIMGQLNPEAFVFVLLPEGERDLFNQAAALIPESIRSRVKPAVFELPIVNEGTLNTWEMVQWLDRHPQFQGQTLVLLKGVQLNFAEGEGTLLEQMTILRWSFAAGVFLSLPAHSFSLLLKLQAEIATLWQA